MQEGNGKWQEGRMGKWMEGREEGREVPYLALHFLDYVGAAVPVTMLGLGICVFNPTTYSAVAVRLITIEVVLMVVMGGVGYGISHQQSHSRSWDSTLCRAHVAPLS